MRVVFAPLGACRPFSLGRLKGKSGERHSSPALREVMHTVSEVKEIKHAYRAGIRARQGVDY